MNTTLSLPTARAVAVRPFAPAMAQGLRRLVDRLRMLRQQARAHRDLMALNDHLLRDLGFERHQLDMLLRSKA